MAEFKHLVIVKFKKDVDVEAIMKGMEELVSGIDLVKSFERGQDTEGQEMLTQIHPHFPNVFWSKEDYSALASNLKHLRFSPKFSVAIEKVIVLDFPAIIVKAAAAAA